MTAVIHFKPILGILPEEPLAYLLTIDECRILIDCGWTDLLDPLILEPLRSIAPEIDLVLISHADMAHMGGLPYAMSKLGLKKAKIYGTVPVYNMGKLFLYDIYQSKKLDEDFDLLSIEDIDAVFENDRFIQLKYSQRASLSGKLQGIELVPYASGHSIGGTVWKISKDTEEILYALDYNNKAERHLNGTVLGQPTGPKTPSILITDVYYSKNHAVPNRAERDENLFQAVTKTLRNNGNVLIPTDTAARLLELLIVLDSQWSFHKLPYHLILLNKVGYHTQKIAQTQLEWMSDSVRKMFENSRENPFAFKCLKLCYAAENLSDYRGPKVVLCTSPTLEFGFSRRLFIEWAGDPKNCIIFPERALSKCLASDLIRAYTANNPLLPLVPQKSDSTSSAPAQLPPPVPFAISLTVKRRVPLVGEELAAWERKRFEEKQKQMEAEAEERRKRELEEQDDDEEDMDVAPRQSHFSDKRFDLILPNFEVAVPPYPMFPFKERIIQWDDYGATFQGEPLISAAAAASAALANGTGAAEKGTDGKAREEEMDGDDADEEEQQATKCIVENVNLSVHCTMYLIDFESRADFRSVKNITVGLNPTRLILVHSSAENKAALLSQLPKAEMREKTYIPSSASEGELNLTSDSRIYPLKLKDQLLETLNFVQEGDYELAYVHGLIQPPDKGSTVHVLAEMQNNASTGHPAVFIGDVKLSELRQFLSRAGFYTELQAGVLVCNRCVWIRKDDTPAEFRSALTVDGILCDDYFRIRELLYQQFKIL